MKLAAHPRLNRHPLYQGTTSIVKGKAVWNGTLTVLPDEHKGWNWPLRWRGATNPAHPPKLGPGRPSLIFVGDMTDVFHARRPRAVIERVIAPVAASEHIGQFLTKRPDVMAEVLASWVGLRDHIWAGFSAEDQKRFDERWPHMRRLADLGFTIFVSYEPAFGPLVLPPDFLALGSRAQVIAGGASGSEAWAACPEWFSAVRDQCVAANVAFFFKQWGEWSAWDDEHDWIPARGCAVTPDGRVFTDARAINRTPADTEFWLMQRTGKSRAGRLLDGREWNDFPVSP
jgi:protein gp37